MGFVVDDELGEDDGDLGDLAEGSSGWHGFGC